MLQGGVLRGRSTLGSNQSDLSETQKMFMNNTQIVQVHIENVQGSQFLIIFAAQMIYKVACMVEPVAF